VKKEDSMKNLIDCLMVAVFIGLPVWVLTGGTGCAGSRYERSTGEYIDDKAVASRVRSALGDNPEFKFDDVIVVAYRGTVQLSGFVNTSDQKQKAGEIAKTIQGVRNVENNITVKAKLG
jgi:osmotically-inducible protein OsmY